MALELYILYLTFEIQEMALILNVFCFTIQRNSDRLIYYIIVIVIVDNNKYQIYKK